MQKLPCGDPYNTLPLVFQAGCSRDVPCMDCVHPRVVARDPLACGSGPQHGCTSCRQAGRWGRQPGSGQEDQLGPRQVPGVCGASSLGREHGCHMRLPSQRSRARLGCPPVLNAPMMDVLRAPWGLLDELVCSISVRAALEKQT